MTEEKFELIEEIHWQNDPPENEDEESATPTANAEDQADEDDELAPLDDSEPKPITSGGGP